MNRPQSGTPFTRSREAHCILFELLFVHGGTPGLRRAVALCRSAHARGALSYFLLPGTGSSGTAGNGSTGSTGGGEAAAEGDSATATVTGGQASLDAPISSTDCSGGGDSTAAAGSAVRRLGGGTGGTGAPEPGSLVVLEGASRIQAIVVLLAWLAGLRQCAR